MVFGYARVSTDEQNLDLQIDALKKYKCDEIYEEKISTRKINRQQLTILLGKLRVGDTLVVWKLDRLGRTVIQLLDLVEDFNSKGINFVSLQEKFDTTTPMGRYVFLMFCGLAQMERDIISERTKAGLNAARKRGRVGGRKPTDDKIIQRALKMYHSNEFSINEILESTRISKTTLYTYIKKGENQNGEL